jgi:hypothetical protein
VPERKAYPGGGVSTRQLNTPGYWHDEHSSVHIMIQGNPMLRNDELGLISQRYTHDKIKIHLLRLVSENLQCPDELGTGMGVLLMPGIIHTRGGRASGVRLSSGETLSARDGVIGAIHPHVVRKSVEGVPEPVMQRAERDTLAPFSIMVSHCDLKRNAQFYAGDEVGHATMLEFMATDRLDEMLDDFDGLRRGRITERRLCAGGDESIADKTRVPAGAGMFHGITLAPYTLKGGRFGGRHWDEVKEEIGDLHGVAPYFYQSAGHRPTPDLGQFTVPGVDRRFLVGPFQHPGGGVYGAGRATAIKMFEQLGMDFGQVSAGVRHDSGVPATVAAARRDGMVLRGAANEALMHVASMDRVGNERVITGKNFGTMPMQARLDADSARAGLKLLGLGKLAFLASLPFRKGGGQ